MIDLNKIAQEAIQKIENEGFIKEKVEETLKKTLASIVDDAFSPWGNFGKELKIEVQNKLQVNFKEFDLPSYNAFIISAINEKLEAELKSKGIEKLQEQLEKMMSTAKPEYKLTELLEEFIEVQSDFHDDYDDRFTLLIEKLCSSHIVYIDEDEYKEKYECKYKLHINEKGEVYSMNIKGNKLDKETIMSGFDSFEDLLFRIYAAGSKVIIEHEDPCYYNTCYHDED